MKIFTGKVVSTKNPKTATVEVTRVFTHPIYKKRIRSSKRYHVHDEFGVKVGETVKFVECKPYSKTKKWRIVKVLGKAKTL